MRFLLNMNIPRRLSRHLEKMGHSSRHVGDMGKTEALDREIIAEAQRSKEVIITHDLDYGRLLAFSRESTPSVIIFRLRNTHPEVLTKRISDVWPKIEKSISEGAIITIEDAAVRIRGLPFDRLPTELER